MFKSGSGIWILLVTAWMLTSANCTPNVEASVPNPEQQLELDTLKGQISDQQRSTKTRFEAARMLLGKDMPQANEALTQFLADSSNPGAQQAVAEAIAAVGGQSPSFVDPLIEMLTGDEPSVRPSAARALVTYQDPAVTDRVMAVAGDLKLDIAIRLETIKALQHVIDRRYIQALINLLDDPDSAVRAASAESLARLTNIRTFGMNRKAWQTWWLENKNKKQIEWMTGLAERLTRSKMTFENENINLRERLVKAKQDIYDSSVKEQKEEILLELLKDPIGDIRLLGVTLTDRRLAANEEIGPMVRQSVQALLDDENPLNRQAVAMLEANLGDPGTENLLLGRLKVEQIPSVRVGLLTALGQLKSPHAMPAVLKAISSINAEEATAAAGALARITEAKPLEGTQKVRAAKVLVDRYALALKGKNDQTLREALLRAMGIMGDPSATKMLTAALKDPAGVIRLAAVNGLARQGANGAAGEIANLVGDPDRGVRQAAITALTALGETNYIQKILERTDPNIESDPDVRKQALEGVLAYCQKADVATLETILDLLKNQAKVDDLEVQILSLYLKALRRENPDSPKLISALRSLGQILVATGRAEEAVQVFEELFRITQAEESADDQPATKKAWLEYFSAMLEANSTAVAEALKVQADQATFNKALDLFNARIDVLMQQKSNLPAISLMEAMLAENTGPLTQTQIETLQKKLAQAKQEQLTADRLSVEKLLPDLLSVDIDKQNDANIKIKAMGTRAVHPLMEQLKQTVSAQPADAKAEQTILDILKQIAPALGDYDTADTKEQKLQQINDWLMQ